MMQGQSRPEMLLHGLLREKNRFHELESRWKPTILAMRRFLNNCRGLTPGLTGCVVWIGSVAHADSSSSPKFYLNGRQVSLRRMIYIWFVGPLGEKKGTPSEWVTTCHKRLCVNPLHLRKRVKDDDKKRKRRRRTTPRVMVMTSRVKTKQRKQARPKKKRKVIGTIGLSIDAKIESSSNLYVDIPACWAVTG